MSYGGANRVISVPESRAASEPKTDCSCGCNGKCAKSEPSAPQQSDGETPDFASMSPAEKIAYHKARWDRILG